MSHELRTPMNAIAGMSWALLKQIEDPAQREKLQIIAKASQHLQTMLGEVLDMVKLESEQLTLEPVDFSLRSLLEHCRAEAATAASAKGLMLTTHYADDLPDMLNSDARRISQMLGHLLANAAKFTAHGSITLRASVSGAAHVQQLHLEVEDTGTGIGNKDIGKLFLPFEQVDTSTTRNHGGTGLGLALCKRLANLMGGDIGVQSRIGQGSVFRLDIPVQPALSSHASNANASAHGATQSPGSLPVAEKAEQEIHNDLLALRALSRSRTTTTIRSCR